MKKYNKQSSERPAVNSGKGGCHRAGAKHCGKILLATASYQIFAVGMGIASAQSLPTDVSHGKFSLLSLPGKAISFLLGSHHTHEPDDNQDVWVLFNCIGCTSGPDNVQGQCVANTGSGGGGGGGGGANPAAGLQQPFYNLGYNIGDALGKALFGDPQARRNEALALNNQGIQYYKNHQWQLAANAFAAALQRSPGDQIIQQNLQNAQAALAEEEREAEARKRAAEARQKQETYDRLASHLKLSGNNSSLGLNNLKLGDNNDDNGTVGIKGLPGLYLNDDTGNGSSRPYGIPGLPGLYSNGPRDGSGLAQSDEKTLSLKLGDGDAATPASPDNSLNGTPNENTANGSGTSASGTTLSNEKDLPSKVGDDSAPSGQANNAAAPPNPPAETTPQPTVASAQDPAANNSALAQLKSVAGDTSGFDGGNGSTLNTSAASAGSDNLHPQGTAFFGLGGGSANPSTPEPVNDPNVVDLRDARTLTVNPAIVQGNPGQMQSQSGGGAHQGAPDKLPPPNPTPQPMVASVQLNSAPGNPGGFDSGNGSTLNYYQKAAGYTGPLRSPGPSPRPQGALGAKLARFQGIIDAMYAADSSYSTNHYPPGYSILQRFTLEHGGTDATLYGKMGADGKPINLILAFRGTTQDISVKWLGHIPYDIDGSKFEATDWTYKNGPNGAGVGSQAYVSAVSIATLVQKEFPGVPMTLTGHSLGGGEAALASVVTGLPAITFNAAGVRPGDYGCGATPDTSHITNYHVLGELLTTSQNTLPLLPTPLPPPPTALGNQITIMPVGVNLSSYIDTTGLHGMEEVKPAMINYLSQH